MADLRALLRGGARAATSLALVWGVGALAHLPLGEPSRAAALRLALRTERARIEVCRDRSAEELAALPAHMRQARDCRETAIDYRLVARLDGRVVVDREVAHHGVRRNRPLTADVLVEVEPGRHEVSIELAPDPEAVPEGAGELPTYRLDGAVEFAVGRVRVASLSGDRFVWLSDTPRPPS